MMVLLLYLGVRVETVATTTGACGGGGGGGCGGIAANVGDVTKPAGDVLLVRRRTESSG